MPNNLLYYLGGMIPLFMGIVHFFPTKSVINGLGNISTDNRLIIAMEWIIEGVMLIFVGIIIIGVTTLGPTNNVGIFIYMSSIIVLLCLSTISFFTGRKVNKLPIKISPVLYTISSILLFLGMLS